MSVARKVVLARAGLDLGSLSPTCTHCGTCTNTFVPMVGALPDIAFISHNPSFRTPGPEALNA